MSTTARLRTLFGFGLLVLFVFGIAPTLARAAHAPVTSSGGLSVSPPVDPPLIPRFPNIQLRNPSDLALDAAGNVYISECTNATGYILKLDTTYRLSIFAGTGVRGFAGDGGPARVAQLHCPAGLAFDGQGNLFFAEVAIHRVRRIAPDGTITTVAGSTPLTRISDFSGDGGPATAAHLNEPSDVTFDAKGNLYIADRRNNRVRMVDRSGIISTVAGNGTFGWSGDAGPALEAQLGTGRTQSSMQIAFDAQGNLYISTGATRRIRKVDPHGFISTVAGNGRLGYRGEGGPATQAELFHPNGLAFDSKGNLYFSDGSHRIRRIDTNGILTTYAGTAKPGYGGDGGPATQALLHAPRGIAFDRDGSLYIADSAAHRIRRVYRSGIIITVAGGD